MSPWSSTSVCRIRWIWQTADESVARSVDWARRGLDRAERLRATSDGWRGGLFAIQQGSLDEGLRRRCTEELAGHDFDGFAIGGLAVGEPSEALHEAVAMAAPMLPASRPRYLMGVGYPEDLVHAVACGVDLFDCVLPTRSARTGKVFTSTGEINIKNARFADDLETAGRGLRLPDLCELFARGAASSLCRKGGHIGGSVDRSQPDLLSELDARGSGSYHGGPLRAVSAADRQYPQSTCHETTGP